MPSRCSTGCRSLPRKLLRLTLRPRYRDVNVWAFIAQHVPEMPGRGLHSRSHPKDRRINSPLKLGRLAGALDSPDRTCRRYHDASAFTSNQDLKMAQPLPGMKPRPDQALSLNM